MIKKWTTSCGGGWSQVHEEEQQRHDSKLKTSIKTSPLESRVSTLKRRQRCDFDLRIPEIKLRPSLLLYYWSCFFRQAVMRTRVDLWQHLRILRKCSYSAGISRGQFFKTLHFWKLVLLKKTKQRASSRERGGSLFRKQIMLETIR